MKKLLLSCLIATGILSYGQTVLFEDDFESYTDFIIADIGDWSMVDIDGLTTYSGGGGSYDNINAAMAFMIFNPTAAGVTNADDPSAEVRNFDAFSGEKYLAAWASPPEAGQGNDDWAVSPAVTLGASENVVEFQVKALSDSYGDEPYGVYVFLGDGEPTGAGDFTQIGGGTATYPDWELVSYDLNAYANQTIRVAIRYTGVDVYMLMVDDFKIMTNSMSVSEVRSERISTVYPNPAIDEVNINLSQKFNADKTTVSLYDMKGEKVASFGSVEDIDVQGLDSGVYVMEISDGINIETKKLMKK